MSTHSNLIILKLCPIVTVFGSIEANHNWVYAFQSALCPTRIFLFFSFLFLFLLFFKTIGEGHAKKLEADSS